MSASKDKINRKQQIEAGTDKRTLAAAEAAKKRRKTNIQYTVVAVILVIVFAFIFIYNSTLPTRHTTAVTINGQKYTPAQVNYYYSNSYMSFYNTYYDYLSYGLFFDTSSSLSSQMYTEDMTWRDYFLDSAIANMTEVQILCDAAEAEGYTLPEDIQAQYDASIESLETSWSSMGYSSLEQYINMNYGKGVDIDMIREELYRNYLAASYAQHLNESYQYTPEEISAYYAEHADEYDMISYVYVTDYDGLITDADSIVSATQGGTEDDFTAYMEENYPDLSTYSLTYGGSDLPSSFGEWLLDDARVPGDVTAISDEESATVVMFLDRNTNEYHPVSFRHVLILAQDTDGDGIYSDEEISAAAETAQNLYDEWLAGDATEDSFAELASANTDDSGSSTNGGLYETVTQGQMVEPIDTWLFDEARQPGDTEILSYDGSNYTGTHIVYFVGEDDMTYAEYVSDNAMRSNDYTEWMTAQKDAAEVNIHSLSLCGKNH